MILQDRRIFETHGTEAAIQIRQVRLRAGAVKTLIIDYENFECKAV